MKKNGLRWAFLYGVSLWLAPTSHGGAWNQPKGHGQIISAAAFSTASRAYDDQSDDILDVSYQKIETSLYFEHGLTPRLTLVARPSLQDVELVDSGGAQSYQGLGPSEIGLQWQLNKSDHGQLSLRGSVRVGSDGENIPDAAIGEGGSDYEMRVLWGQGFALSGRSAFIEGQLAYRLRADGAPNEQRFDFTSGLELTPRIQVLAQSFYIKADGAQFPLRDYESLKLQASAVMRLSNGQSVQVGAFQTVTGRDIIKESGLMAALWTPY